MSEFIITVEEFDTDDPWHLEFASDFEAWREEHGKKLLKDEQMLPLDREHLEQHFFGVVAFIQIEGQDRQPAGYNALTFEFEDGSYEIGGLIVNPEFTGQGIAKIIKREIILRASRRFPTGKLITFANSNSEEINRRHGFVDAEVEEIPESSLSICRDECTKYNQLQADNLTVPEEERRICCDTILVCDLSQVSEVGVSID